MNERDDLRALARLAGISHAAHEARFAALLRQEAELRAKLDQLDQARRARAESLTEADPSLTAGADLRWHRWIESRRSALNADLARTLVRIATQRAEMARAFGRKEAMGELTRNADDLRRLQLAKSAERGW